ncbi:MAG: LPS export ABC transporter periplasmic protein LptC [Alphaproteobacteria bacterium]|nr:LPS export ABC transporter periplasmic protein LptC [Alphaproteobacteria bacterium]
MFDSKKIDSYFDNRQNFELSKSGLQRNSISWRRLFKLTLPCVAAALLGIMVVMPNIRKSADLKDNVTIPRKGEMEKLHIEQTVFNSTDNKNRVNKIVADSVDETTPGSKIMKIINPRGRIPTDSGVADITASEGIFNQNDNILNLSSDVRAVVDNDTVITSAEANYDFGKEYGWGDKDIKAEGQWGNLTAEAFTYDKNEEILTLKGYNKIISQKSVLSANEETIIYQKENKSVSYGKASFSQNGKKLFADKITAYFSETEKKELVRAEALGNVIIKTERETISGKEGYYNPQIGEMILYGDAKDDKDGKGYVSVRQGKNVLYAKKITAYSDISGNKDLRKVIALGNVKIVTPKETATGKEGHYYPQTGEVQLFGNFLTEARKNGHVTIKQGDNILMAEKITAYIDKGKKGDLIKAIAVGKVNVRTPKGNARGDRGIYNPKENMVELFDNVRIEQNGNFIDGAHAQTDLLTSISKITGDENTGGRIHGIFYKTRKTGNGDKTKK